MLFQSALLIQSVTSSTQQMVANLRQMLEDAMERELLEALFQRILVIYFMTV